MTLADIMAVLTRSALYTALTSLCLLTLLSPRSAKARFYLNSLIYVSSIGVCSVWGILIALVCSLLGRGIDANHYVARSFYLLAGSLIGVRFDVEGEHHFAQARPAVLVGNHLTAVDILYLGRIFPKAASIMAKQELKYSPLLGQFMTLSGAVFINRKDRKDAVKAFDQVGRDMKKSGVSLWVFPEGTRSNMAVPDLLPFKKGAFHLAVQAQVPIVPVVCENYNRLFDGKTRFEGGRLRIKVLEPVPTKGLSPNDVTELTERVRSLMLAELRAMDAQRDALDARLAAASGATVPRRSWRPSGLAGWLSYLVGTGKVRDAAAEARRDEERLRKVGTSGQRPEHYGLVSAREAAAAEATERAEVTAEATYDAVAKASGVSTTGAAAAGAGAGAQREQQDEQQRRLRRKAATAASGGSGSDETDDGNVLVRKPDGEGGGDVAGGAA